MTLDEIYLHYISTKEITLSPKTVGSYKSAYEKHIRPVFGNRDISTIHFIDYQKFADKLIVSGLKPKTVKNILRVISPLYTFASKHGWYHGENYPSMVELPKYDNKFYVTMSPEQQRAYLGALKSATEPVIKDIFLFLLHGRRLGEVIKLEWQYLDLNQGIVYYPATHNKAKRFLSYELTDALIAVLKEHHNKACEMQSTVFPTGYVFLNPDTNKPYSDTGVRNAWKRLLKHHGLPYVKLHNIRHILGTYLINELGLSVETVSYVLGHQDTNITKRYVHIKPKVAKDAIVTLFDSFKTEDQRYVEQINQAYNIGHAVQAVLFSNQKHEEVVR